MTNVLKIKRSKKPLLSTAEGLLINDALFYGNMRSLFSRLADYLETNGKQIPADILERYHDRGLIEKPDED